VVVVTVGTGLTTIENERVMLLQVLDIAVTVKKLTMGTLEGVVEVNAGMLPLPEVDANPMAGLEFVQL
jgi:hypothetical protein